ncbi:DUF4349 domain-containing protein [Demequina sp.]|uniref:DUF4349 domain-containing protein n=1 Tax=Demequina sp. TaxID=2050685 RepID=UPI003D119FB2
MTTTAGAAMTRFRLAALVLLVVLAGALLAGCSSSADGLASAAGAPVIEADAGADSAANGDVSNETPASSRSMIVTGSMYMTVDKPLEAADQASTMVNDAGGRVDARSETAADEWNGASASLVLRIPASKLDAVVEQLRSLGTVDQFETTASDVTNKVTDLDAKISTLRASTLRIEGLLADAKDIADIIKLENELESRQAELESLEAEQRGLNDQVSLSTIELSLTTVPVEAADESSSTFVDGLATGWNGLVNFFSVVLVALGVLLPWLVVFGVIGVAVIAVVRWRKSRAGKVDAQPAAPVAEEPLDEVTTAP